MDQRAALLEIDATLRDRGFVSLLSGIADYEGVIRVHGTPATVRISIPDVRFAVLPTITLLDREAIKLGSLAHLLSDNDICYNSAAGIPVDMYSPGAAVLRFLRDAEITLESSFKGRAAFEIAQEYQQYWNPKYTALCLLPRRGPDIEDSQLVFAKRNGDRIFAIIDSAGSIPEFSVDISVPVRVYRLNGTLMPLDGLRVPHSTIELKRWYTAQQIDGPSWDRLFSDLIRKKYVFLAAKNAILGIELTLPADLKAAVLRKSIRQVKLVEVAARQMPRINLNRVGAKWSGLKDVTTRNMANRTTLEGRTIAVIGCGTIGSHLAKFLAQSGAGCGAKLSLYDKDLLAEGNLGRHLLGFGDIGSPKASSVATELKRFHPHLDVVGYDIDAFADWQALVRNDLVIDATGDWNVQNALNNGFMTGAGGRPNAVLHAWVFMNGAGVQSFLNLRDDYACFRCLKPIFDEPWRYPAGDESLLLNLQPASCGDGVYVPYSVDVPVIAAALANRATIDWAGGRPGQRLRSQVTDQATGKHQKWVSPTPAADCPACKSLRIK